MNDEVEKRSGDSNRVWEKIGKLDGRVDGLENAKNQLEHSFLNHRALVHEDLRTLDQKIADFEVKLQLFFKPIFDRIARIERFMYIATGLGVSLGFVFQAIIHWQSVKEFFK